MAGTNNLKNTLYYVICIALIYAVIIELNKQCSLTFLFINIICQSCFGEYSKNKKSCPKKKKQH